MIILNLTIAIPTFNREEKAGILIEKLLLLGINYKFELIIADNNSNSYFLREKFLHRQDNIKYIRRVVNIGPTANIMRLFEESTTKWLMIIGDDDGLDPNFFDIITEKIDLLESSLDNKVEVGGVKFRTLLQSNQKNRTIESFAEFIQTLSTPDNFGSTILISSWLFNRKLLVEYVRFSYLYAGLQMPHVVPLLAALKEGRCTICYSDSTPVVHNQPDIDSSWNAGLTYSLMLSNACLFSFFESEKDFNNMAMGIVGVKSKTIAGYLLKSHLYFEHYSFKYISNLVGSLSLKHKLITIIFPILYRVAPKNLIKNFIELNSSSKNIKRM